MLISVVVPNRNGEKYIKDTLESIVAQSNCNVELIVVDGASSDRSMAIIDTFANSIKSCISEQDKGMYDAINKGIKLSNGKILAYLNSDDNYLPGTLEYVSNYFESNPNVDMIYGNLLFIDSNGHRIFRQYYPDFNFKYFSALNFQSIGQSACFFRRTVWESIGGFDENLRMAGDFDFFLRATRVSKVKHCDRFLAAFRIHCGSLTKTQIELNKTELTLIKKRMFGEKKYRASKHVVFIARLRFIKVNLRGYWDRFLRIFSL